MTGSRLREALERIVVAFDDNRLGEVVTIARAALEDQGEAPVGGGDSTATVAERDGNETVAPSAPTAACPRCEDWRKMGLSSYCPSHEPTAACTNPDCLDGYIQEFSLEGLRVKGKPCPDCTPKPAPPSDYLCPKCGSINLDWNSCLNCGVLYAIPQTDAASGAVGSVEEAWSDFFDWLRQQDGRWLRQQDGRPSDPFDIAY